MFDWIKIAGVAADPRRDKLSITVKYPRDPLSDSHDHLVRIGAHEVSHFLDRRRSRLRVSAQDRDNVPNVGLRTIRNLDDDLIHRDAANHGRPLAIDTYPGSSGQRAPVAVRVPNRHQGCAHWRSGAKRPVVSNCISGAKAIRRVMRLSMLMPERMPGNNGTADEGGTPYSAIPARAMAIVGPAPR